MISLLNLYGQPDNSIKALELPDVSF